MLIFAIVYYRRIYCHFLRLLTLQLNHFHSTLSSQMSQNGLSFSAVSPTQPVLLFGMLDVHGFDFFLHKMNLRYVLIVRKTLGFLSRGVLVGTEMIFWGGLGIVPSQLPLFHRQNYRLITAILGWPPLTNPQYFYFHRPPTPHPKPTTQLLNWSWTELSIVLSRLSQAITLFEPIW